MDCYICNEETIDESKCEHHRFMLEPLAIFMQELTGCDFYTQTNSPFMYISLGHVNYIKSFIAGARLRLTVKKIGSDYRLIASDKRCFDFITEDEIP